MTTTYRPGYEVAAEQILELIARNGWRTGDRLPTEQALAVELGISRSVTREGVKVLTALGRVSAHRGRGLYVGGSNGPLGGSFLAGEGFMPGDPDQVEQLLKFRQIQEVAAARGAALVATPPDLRLLREALEKGQQSLDLDDQAGWDESDERFHLGIAAASGNAFLRAAIAHARDLQRQVIVLGLRGGTGGSLCDAQAEHQAIYQAISDGDPEGAGGAVDQHLGHTLRGYRAAISAALRAADAAH